MSPCAKCTELHEKQIDVSPHEHLCALPESQDKDIRGEGYRRTPGFYKNYRCTLCSSRFIRDIDEGSEDAVWLCFSPPDPS